MSESWFAYKDDDCEISYTRDISRNPGKLVRLMHLTKGRWPDNTRLISICNCPQKPEINHFSGNVFTSEEYLNTKKVVVYTC